MSVSKAFYLTAEANSFWGYSVSFKLHGKMNNMSYALCTFSCFLKVIIVLVLYCIEINQQKNHIISRKSIKKIWVNNIKLI